jgi:hypothetical protein
MVEHGVGVRIEPVTINSALEAARADPHPLAVVVAVGASAHEALPRLTRNWNRCWSTLALGAGAELARADRQIAAGITSELIPQLEEEWLRALLICVVVDPGDTESVALADRVLVHASDPERPSILVGAGRGGEIPLDLARCADAVLSRDAGVEVSDALAALLAPFTRLAWFHPANACALLDVQRTLKGLRRPEARVSRCRPEAIVQCLRSIIGPGDVHRQRLASVSVARNADHGVRTVPAARGVLDDLEAYPALHVTVDEDYALGPEEVVVGAIVEAPRPLSAPAVLRLVERVERGVAELFPRDARTLPYAARLRHELDWFTEHEQRSAAAVALDDAAERLRDRGRIVGPLRHPAGGSLVLYALGLSPIDPIAWDLSFEAFTGNGALLHLEATASFGAMEEQELPSVDWLRGSFRWGFAADPRLDVLEELHARAPYRLKANLRFDRGVCAALRSVRGSVWARLAPRDVDELAAAQALRDLDESDDLLLDWCGSGDPALSDRVVVPESAALTDRTRGCIVFPDQVAGAIARIFGLTETRARTFARALAKNSADEWLEKLRELGRRLGQDPADLERRLERLHVRATPGPSRAEALGDALVDLAVVRSLTRARASTDPTLSFVTRGTPHGLELLRTVPSFETILRPGTRLLGEWRGRHVRLSSELLPRFCDVPLRLGRDYRVVDSVHARHEGVSR